MGQIQKKNTAQKWRKWITLRTGTDESRCAKNEEWTLQDECHAKERVSLWSNTDGSNFNNCRFKPSQMLRRIDNPTKLESSATPL
jgi:hypothetical protein